MAKIQELLAGKDERINYYNILSSYPWIIERERMCILSPDSDGLLCGLFMSHYLGWKIVGYYDGKIMLLKDGVKASDCIFLDMEIYRENIKSIGHHMIIYNKRQNIIDLNKYTSCIQPNLLREYDGRNDFRLKYPLATIHLLVSIISQKIQIELSDDAVAPLFFTDGTFNVLFSYPENVLNWLNYLRIVETNNPLNKIFCTTKYTPYELMREMDDFFRQRDKISISRERGDRLRISNTDGSPANCVLSSECIYQINQEAIQRIERFIHILEKFTLWKYDISAWSWDQLCLYQFTKQDFKGMGNRVNGKTFKEMIEKNPLSWAMTSGDNIEFTLEEPDKLY